MPMRRLSLAAGVLLVTLAQAANAQQATPPADSARAQIRAVLRAFYFNLEHQNWEALSTYVLSPKLLERRGAPSDLEMVTRDRGRRRASAHADALSRACPARTSPQVEEADIRLDGDWAEVSVSRCSGASAGVDEFRMLYFEQRWRFIYTDLFEAQPISGR
jgi:hypothetical protein